MMEFYKEILAEAKDAPGDETIWPFKRPQEIRHSAFGQAVMIGTPDQVARKLEQFCQEFRCTHLIMSTQLPGLDPRKGTRALELFAREVMPSFRNA
jgi:alkanesulfonate monooxygenase SsuD/methylene tetrahydromethanopterin reductase-like flavin-dependent oxidoreductase (luciferase family)